MLQNELTSLLRWSYLRNKSLFLLCSLLQVLMTIAIVYGYSLLMPSLDNQTRDYLASGAITLGLISIGCTIAPQSISSDKRNGVVTYLRTLPVRRVTMLLSELLIWSLSSVLGIVLSIGVVFSRYHLLPKVTVSSVFIMLLGLLTMISLGFAIAYSCRPSLMAVSTQLLLMVGLLFSPITYPADRLPDYVVAVYNYLPFTAAGNMIRETVYGGGAVVSRDLVVVLVWLVITFVTSLWQLERVR